jgi:hypothetical protein
MVQINRPRPSRVLGESQEINRLGKWAGVVVTMLMGDESGQFISTSPHFGVQGEADVSTDAERQEPLPPERRSELLQELFQTSLEIINRGDQR